MTDRLWGPPKSYSTTQYVQREATLCLLGQSHDPESTSKTLFSAGRGADPARQLRYVSEQPLHFLTATGTITQSKSEKEHSRDE